MRARFLLLALLALPVAAQSGPEPGAGGGGAISSPITTDPLALSGTVTLGAASSTAANGVTWNPSTNCYDFEGTASDAADFHLCNLTTGVSGSIYMQPLSGHVKLCDESGCSAGSSIDLDGLWTVDGIRSFAIVNSATQINIGSAAQLTASTTSDAAAGTVDVGLGRAAAGVWKATNGTSGTGWVQNSAGRATLASDYTNATTTFSNTTLSVTVTSGRKYTFVVRAFGTDSTAADGAKFDFNGGTAAATNFRVHCTLFDTALLFSTQATALATALSSATVTGASMLECAGSFEPSGSGTFIVRAAQNAHTAGTLTLNRGSYLWVEDTP